MDFLHIQEASSAQPQALVLVQAQVLAQAQVQALALERIPSLSLALSCLMLSCWTEASVGFASAVWARVRTVLSRVAPFAEARQSGQSSSTWVSVSVSVLAWCGPLGGAHRQWRCAHRVGRHRGGLVWLTQESAQTALNQWPLKQQMYWSSINRLPVSAESVWPCR